MIEEIYAILPSNIKYIIKNIPDEVKNRIEEIRIRENSPLEIMYENNYYFLSHDGKVSQNPKSSYLPNFDDTNRILNLISNHSIYRLEEELKRGYITVHGGHRIGITGKVILDKGEVKTIRDITSFNIRLARQVIGSSQSIIPYIINTYEDKVFNTLIISPPQCGKTTLLRDIARQIGTGIKKYNFSAKKVGIVDERSEIAGCVKGVPQNNVGYRTDVLDACPKAEGMMMLIRAMSPEILIADEIGRQEDTMAILEARNAGVNIVVTAHGSNLNDVAKRPTISSLIQQEVFSRYIILSRKNGVGTVEEILDEKLEHVFRKKIYA